MKEDRIKKVVIKSTVIISSNFFIYKFYYDYERIF